MKRFISLLLSVVIVLSVPLIVFDTAIADEINSDYKFIENEDGTLTLTDYIGNGFDVNIPEKIDGKEVNIIGEGAFEATGLFDNYKSADCIRTVYIPKSVKKIQGFNFKTPFLNSIEVDKDNAYYSSDNGVLFNKEKSALLLYPIARLGNYYEIPASVKIIDRGAFSNSKYLSEVKIGKNVAEIKESAFINCINIKHIYIPNSVKKMKRCGLGIQKRIACEYSENEAECFYETITGFKIYGKKGSAGEEYCNNRKNYFVPAEYGNSLNNYSFENLTFVETPLKAKPSLKVKGKKGKATLTLKNYFIEGGAYSYSDYQISIVKGKKNYGESFNNYRKGIKAVNGKLIYTLKLPKGSYKIRYRASFYVSGRKLKTKWSKTKTVVVR
ncbi:MAG: leucine-rich repeat protein [Eubacterium sp.]|nr:leucine-rich repeat protein [Eubacterium sp.]